MFAPVLLEVPGQMTRCPCGFGAYAVNGRMTDDKCQTRCGSLNRLKFP